MSNDGLDRTFRLTTLEREPPPGGADGVWHRYVIRNDLTEIRGFARGSKREVMRRTTKYVEALNAKNDPRTSRGSWAPKRARTAAAVKR